jgi:hypothetical protein
MKNIFIIIFTLTFYASTISADDHKVMPGNEVGEFHYIKATNPLNVVAATDKFMASDCGKKWKSETGANVVLMQLQGSGMSHFFYVGFSDYEKMDLGQKLSNCAANFEFLQEIGANTHDDMYFNRIGELSLLRGDWTKDAVFFKYDLYVEPAKAGEYAAAWSKMTNEVGGPGSQGLVTHITGNGYASHFAFVGASSMLELSSETQGAFATEAFAKFAEEVGGYRKVQNVMMVTPIKGW